MLINENVGKKINALLVAKSKLKVRGLHIGKANLYEKKLYRMQLLRKCMHAIKLNTVKYVACMHMQAYPLQHYKLKTLACILPVYG